MLKVLTAVALFTMTSAAFAQSASPVCEDLARQLSSLTDRIGPTAQARKYSKAIAAQRFNMRALAREMRQSGCGSDSIIHVGDTEDQCAEYADKMARMERNLDILDQKRISLLNDETTGMERQRLIAAIEDQGCNSEAPVILTTTEDRKPSPLLSPDGFETIRVPDQSADYSQSQFVDLGGNGDTGSYRTMCVRSCDGGYFPVSSRASSTNFRRDAQVCSMMCPGMETELYYHSISQESDDMRSAETGRLYRDLPNAYRFRLGEQSDKKECGCNFALYYQEMLRREAFVKNPDQPPRQESAITWMKPELRGGLKSEPILSNPVKRVERPYDPKNPIRVIGPRFLPDGKTLDFTGSIPEEAKAAASAK